MSEDFNKHKLQLALDARIAFSNSKEFHEELRVVKQAFFELRQEKHLAPADLLRIQEVLLTELFRFQKEQEKNHAFYSELIHITKGVADVIAWRVLGYPRALFQILSLHNPTGGLDGNTYVEFERLKEFVINPETYGILNDLTGILRIGDVTLITNDNGIPRIQFIEVKNTPTRKATDRRSRQQQDKVDAFNRFFDGEIDFLLFKKIKHIVFRSHFKPDYLFDNLSNGLDLAKQNNGYCCLNPVEGMTLEIINRGYLPTGPAPENPHDKALSEREAISFFSVLPLGNRLGLSAFVPYGAFPIGDEDCYDIMTHRILYRVTLEVDALIKLYSDYGIELTINKPTPEQSKNFSDAVKNSPSGSRKQAKLEKDGMLNLTLKYGDLIVNVHQNFFAPIFINLMNPAAFVALHAEKLRIENEMLISGNFNPETQMIHLAFDESQTWI